MGLKVKKSNGMRSSAEENQCCVSWKMPEGRSLPFPQAMQKEVSIYLCDCVGRLIALGMRRTPPLKVGCCCHWGGGNFFHWRKRFIRV
jgi:hypothetical protein